ncbi:MAG: hypothetical protein NTW09_01145 [Candidatus Omnitrophica bacterium]|nr:hypothetical protein [Candidatus Omnitrophota bacterium]
MMKFTWVVVVLVILGIFFAGNIFAEDGAYKISAMKGNVLIKRIGTEDWVEAKVGDVLNKGDSIKTMEDGLVYLETSPNIGFTMRPNSEFIMDNTLEPPVAEPYTEPGRDRIDNVVAPEVNQEGAASRI